MSASYELGTRKHYLMRQGFLILLEMRNLRLSGVKSCLLTNGCAVILIETLLLCCFVLRIVAIMRYPGRADERENTQLEKGENS